MKNVTVTVFRKFKDSGAIIALFPLEVADPQGNVGSYQHLGQHGAADYKHIMKTSVATTDEESKPLADELVSLGYSLVVKKRNRGKNKPKVNSNDDMQHAGEDSVL